MIYELRISSYLRSYILRSSYNRYIKDVLRINQEFEQKLTKGTKFIPRILGINWLFNRITVSVPLVWERDLSDLSFVFSLTAVTAFGNCEK